MPLKSALELLIVLLYSNNKEKIEGITRLIKLIFLLIKEGGFSEFEKEVDFEAYHYGPWSAEIYLDYTKTLEEIGIIKIEEKESIEPDIDTIYFSDVEELREGKMKIFSLTKKGEKVGKVLFERLTEEEKKKIEEIKRGWNHRSLNELIEYIYYKYIGYTKKSKIKNEVLSKLGVSPSLIKLVGTIPIISLKDEKRMIRKAISERVK